jgi:hypothetical protein
LHLRCNNSQRLRLKSDFSFTNSHACFLVRPFERSHCRFEVLFTILKVKPISALAVILIISMSVVIVVRGSHHKVEIATFFFNDTAGVVLICRQSYVNWRSSSLGPQVEKKCSHFTVFSATSKIKHYHIRANILLREGHRIKFPLKIINIVVKS